VKQEVTVVAGDTATVQGDLLQPVEVRVSVGPGAVRIAGAVHPNGTVLRLAPGNVKVDLVRGAEVIPGRYVTVSRPCTLKTEPELACYE